MRRGRYSFERRDGNTAFMRDPPIGIWKNARNDDYLHSEYASVSR
jgi:hypothetical protein